MTSTKDAHRVEFQEHAISVDASLIGQALGIEPSAVQARMREGKITGLCEQGIDQDAGRYRLSFFDGSRRLRLIVDSEGRVLQRSLVNFGDRPLPASVRKAGS